MRLLGAARLSHRTDESTSIARQKERINSYANSRDPKPTVVHITEDDDVSGATDPFERENLGPWLTDPEKIALWDGLIVTKLDRLTRSLSDFDTLCKWCERNKKIIISVDESLDLSTYMGRMFANILAMFAEFERERIGDRRRQRAADDKARGWWGGGRPPYGYRPVKIGDHWELEVDPETKSIVEWIAGEIIAGKSATSVAQILTERGTPTPGGASKWYQNTIRDMLRNPKTVLDPQTQLKVLDALDSSKANWTKRGDAAMLLNIAYCYDCRSSKAGLKPLYSKRYTSKGHLYEYYTCSANCGARRVSMAGLEEKIAASVAKHAREKWREKHIIPGDNHNAEISIIERRIRELDLDAPDYAETHSQLMTDRSRLKSLPAKADRVEWLETGETIAEHWEKMNLAERRTWLLTQGTKVHAGCHKDRSLYGVVELNVYGLTALDVFGNLPEPTLMERAKASGLDKHTDVEADLDD
jgi:site-specific DNA recombinase